MHFKNSKLEYFVKSQKRVNGRVNLKKTFNLDLGERLSLCFPLLLDLHSSCCLFPCSATWASRALLHPLGFDIPGTRYRQGGETTPRGIFGWAGAVTGACFPGG